MLRLSPVRGEPWVFATYRTGGLDNLNELLHETGHAVHIAANLEWTPEHRGNHYLSDIAGLIFAGAYLPSTEETDVWLAFDDLRRPPAILHAPSHVPSPPIDGARLVLLRVRDFGVSVDQHAVVSSIRRVGSHVYLDEAAP